MKIRLDASFFNVRARWRSIAGGIACALTLASCAGVAPSRSDVGFPVLGYYAWWMAPQDAEIDLTLIDTLFFFDIEIDSTGAIATDRGWPGAWTALIDRARAASTHVVPVVTVPNEAAFRSLFQHPEAVTRLRETLVALALDPASDGLHIDFEVFSPMPSGTREAFTALVAGVAAEVRAARPVALRPEGGGEATRPYAGLSVFLPAFDRPDAFDETAIAAAADYVVVQGYDIHWKDAPRAGPIAPLRGWGGENWEAILARYDALRIRRDRIVFAVPYYGFEWPTVSDEPGAATRGPAQMVTYAPFDSLMPPDFAVAASHRIRENGHRRDTLSGAPYYAYQGEDGWYQGWFEDRESLKLKYDFIRHERLRGAALFALGYDRGEMEPALWEE
ncbi:MAG: glycosyl hydrolase family 18 protein [Rhodothermales bacterium]